MRHLARSLALLLALGFVACSKRPIDSDEGTGGAIGSGQAGAAGSSAGAMAAGTGGAIAGNTGGGAIAGSTGGGAIAGSTGGGATAGNTGGGATAGSSGATGGRGGGTAGSGGSVIAGSGGGPIAGSGGGATAGSGGGNSLGPVRLIIFYTRWGTAYPEWWPTGSDRNFTMSAMLQPLEPHKRDITLVSGLTNANLAASNGQINLADASETGDAMITLLTARPALTGGRGDGPSFDTVIGDCGGAAGPPLRLAVGQFGFDDNPGVSFGADGAAIRGERDPRAVAMRVLGHDITAPDPTGDIDANYPAIGLAHMVVATEALATSKACVVTLMWGDHVVPRWLGATQQVHELSHLANDLNSSVSSQPPTPNPSSPFVKLQTWYAQQFAALLERLRGTPLGAGTLLDRSVVVWISDSGAGQDHTGAYLPVVIAGGGGGRLDVGRFIEVKPHIPATGQIIEYWSVTRTQGDLLLALSQLWGSPPFGDTRIARQALSEILKP